MTAYETDLLAELIAQKHRCLARMHDLGRRQLQLIDAGNMTELLVILSAKQQLIGELDQIERRLDPFRPQLPEERSWRTEKDRLVCAQQIAQCDAMFAEIVEQEKQGERQLRLRRDEVSARLDGVHSAGHAHGAYISNVATKASELDLTSES